MKIFKPKFWDSNTSIYSLIFYPITLIIICLIFLKRKFTSSKSFNLPVICIGNIYIGGTGKTPLSIFLAKELKEKRKNPAIVKKFYEDHIDEHQLIKKYFKDLILNKNRINAILMAEKDKEIDSVILDDGLQDYKIKKDVKIICFNQKQLLGNGLVFPSGPLRESLEAIKDTKFVIINGKKDNIFEKKLIKINENLKFFYSKYVPTNIQEIKNKNLFAFAGIGNPDNFFQTLIDYGFRVDEKLIFPDHYKFKRKELEDIIDIAKKRNLEIITTEKDFFRIRDFKFNEIKYLKIKLVIEKKEQLIEEILKFYDKNI